MTLDFRKYRKKLREEKKDYLPPMSENDGDDAPNIIAALIAALGGFG